ncbi:MAG: cytochrome C oxidase subunit IV family protein [Candidatus Omnitrophota bacterium]|nr:cytochrome C oxidase subunit IV family protein [Candidatus Omnitrophota bacterium]
MFGHTHDIHKEIRAYLLVFGALLLLTGITVAINRLHLPTHLAVTLALMVACVKGFLVVGFFMHLLSERQLIYSILAFTVFFFFSMMFLTTGNHYNYLLGTRDLSYELMAQQATGVPVEAGHGH